MMPVAMAHFFAYRTYVLLFFFSRLSMMDDDDDTKRTLFSKTKTYYYFLLFLDFWSSAPAGHSLPFSRKQTLAPDPDEQFRNVCVENFFLEVAYVPQVPAGHDRTAVCEPGVRQLLSCEFVVRVCPFFFFLLPFSGSNVCFYSLCVCANLRIFVNLWGWVGLNSSANLKLDRDKSSGRAGCDAVQSACRDSEYIRGQPCYSPPSRATVNIWTRADDADDADDDSLHSFISECALEQLLMVICNMKFYHHDYLAIFPYIVYPSEWFLAPSFSCRRQCLFYLFFY